MNDSFDKWSKKQDCVHDTLKVSVYEWDHHFGIEMGILDYPDCIFDDHNWYEIFS